MWVSLSSRGQPIAFFLTSSTRELDVQRRLEPGADHFALALPRVAVAEEQQRARLVDRQHQLHAGAHARVVHVAAERARRRGRDRFLARRRDADAAKHRPQRQLDAARLHVGLIEPRDTPRALSIVQVTRLALAIDPRAQSLPDRRCRAPAGCSEYAVARFVSSFSMVTTSMSPGSAPST